ncbi:MAG: PQQ-dependent sugar dehydrogenase [Myxococcales bacterium]|nr:PQQ-dependent sugar dehydrogenase [Myxococcales bacterium]
MRHFPRLATAVTLLALAACQKSSAKPDAMVDGDGGTDGAVGDGGTDAPAPDAYVANCVPNTGTTITTVPFVSGLSQPLMITGAPGDRRQFVIEQGGRVKVIDNGQVLAAPALDLGEDDLITAGGERGLLGIAFHPKWLENGLFYIAHTGKNGDHVFAEYQMPTGTSVANKASRRELLRFADPFSNHNGGSMEFGNDGFLYIAIGDGGSGGDPGNRAQNDASFFGKLLRIDVDTRTGNKQYGIPPTNPHAASPDGPTDPRPEVWHKGLRNPFRFSFDRMNGDIYIGDVGQGPNPPNLEEIDVAPNTPGTNWGWPEREANRCFRPATNCPTAGRTDPVIVRGGANGWTSIMGGVVYRGSCYPNLAGKYFYGDYAAGQLWAFTWNGTTAVGDAQIVAGSLGNITAIHDDGNGQLYVVLHGGSIRRVVTQ